MGWVARPSFRIPTRTLDFRTAHNIYNDKAYWHRNHTGANISDRPPGTSKYWIRCQEQMNPRTNKVGACYYLQMYNTHIHTWWEDGTYQSRYWDSAATREVLSYFGPVRVWRDSRLPFEDKSRFGNGDKHYPYGNGITVDPQGFVRNLTDFRQVLCASARAGRRKISETFRDRTLSRILLGEFDIDKFATYQTNIKKPFGRWYTGWAAQVPPARTGIAKAFYEQRGYEDVQKLLNNWHPGRWDYGPVRDTQEAAVVQAVGLMAAQLMNDQKWYEKRATRYDPINVKEL